MRGGNWHMRRWWWKTPAWNSSANRKEGLREKFHRTLGQSLREVGVGLSDLENYINCSTQSPDFDTTHSLTAKASPEPDNETKSKPKADRKPEATSFLFLLYFIQRKQRKQRKQSTVQIDSSLFTDVTRTPWQEARLQNALQIFTDEFNLERKEHPDPDKLAAIKSSPSFFPFYSP